MKKHIATAATYGLSGTRTGTKYLFTEAEIEQYQRELAKIGKSANLRRRKK